MNLAFNFAFFELEWTERFGWSLIHSSWQGLVIAMVTMIILACQKRLSAKVRYWTAWCGLAAMLGAPLLTFFSFGDAKKEVALNRFETPGFSTSSEADAPTKVGVTNSWIRLNDMQKDESIESTGTALTCDESLGTVNWLAIRERFKNVADVVRPWTTYLVLGWWIGVVMMLIRIGVGLVRVHRIKRIAIAIDQSEIIDRVRTMARRVGVQSSFSLRKLPQGDVPAVMGWLQPVLLVPDNLIASMAPKELDALMAHELAHIRRNDFAWNLVQIAIESLLFFHPAVWLVSRVIRDERELCCDDVAMQAIEKGWVLAKALAYIEELRCGSPGLAMSARSNTPFRRIQRIVKRKNASGPIGRDSRIMVVISASLLLGILTVASGIASELTGPIIQPPGKGAQSGPPSPPPPAKKTDTDQPQVPSSAKVKEATQKIYIEVKQQPWVNSVYPLYLIQGETRLDFDRFQEQLQEHGVRKDTSIVIRAHANAHAEWVEKLMVTLQRHGFQRVSLTLLAEGNTQTVGSTSIRNGSVRSKTSEWSAMAEGSAIQFRLVCDAEKYEAGKTIPLKLEVKNSGTEPASLDFQAYAPFRVLVVEQRFPDKTTKEIPFIGMRPQTSGGPTVIAPGDTKTVWEKVDLSTLFLMDNGKFEIFTILKARNKWTGDLEAFDRLALEIEKGELQPRQRLMMKLEKKLPEGWELSTGFEAIYLRHSPTNLKKDVRSIELIIMDESPKDLSPSTIPFEKGSLKITPSQGVVDLWPNYMDVIRSAAQEPSK